MATRSTTRSRTDIQTNSKRRILRELPLALLDDAWRCVLFIVDLILLATLAFSTFALVLPAARSWIVAP